MKPTEQQAAHAFKLMQENAFLFYELRDTIRQDARLYNAPVYIKIPFTDYYPTLGHYIRWWENSQVANFVKDNRRWLIYAFVGNPMTGSSCSYAVCEDGHHETFRGISFGALIHSFSEEKENTSSNILPSEEIFTLEQTVAILQSQKQ